MSDRVERVIAQCRHLALEGCYCCEVFPVDDDGHECERCEQLRLVADLLESLTKGDPCD